MSPPSSNAPKANAGQVFHDLAGLVASVRMLLDSDALWISESAYDQLDALQRSVGRLSVALDDACSRQLEESD